MCCAVIWVAQCWDIAPQTSASSFVLEQHRLFTLLKLLLHLNSVTSSKITFGPLNYI